ncbi:MAG: PLP-dependent aminotransferase family protein [Lachnospiraceae bacterium]|nr:PLP-dependent aminotransferase family protein [Lachnospiraceae bacterium]
MLTYDLEKRGNIPLYDYLYRCIKDDILAGNIKPFEKLPSKRTLAKHLNISIITVENAYAQLNLEGYIYSLEAKGYYANSLQKTNVSKDELPVVEETQEFEYEFFADFRANRMRRMNFPFSVWSKLMREILSSQDIRLLKTVPFNGVYELRAAIAKYLHDFRGMQVSPNQVIIGAGIEFLYSRIIKLLGTECRFAIENIGYKKIYEIYDNYGAKWESVAMDNSGMSLKELKDSKANVIHISPAHHFPTGMVMPVKRRQELLSWANEADNRYIIEDDYDSEFRYLGKPIPTMYSMDNSGRVIYMNTFSKSLIPSLRISYMVLPNDILDTYEKTVSFYSCTVSSFEQYTLAKFISEGYFERHINRMKNHYKNQRDLLLNAIKNSRLSNIAEVYEENAGTHFLLKVNTRLTDAQIIEKAKKEDIDISCLSEYCIRNSKNVEGTLVVNYAGVHKERIEEAIKRLERIFF